MLVFNRPIEPPTSGPAPAAAPGAAPLPPRIDFSVLDLIRALFRRKLLIAATALACACLAVVVGKSLTPKYTATAQLYVDPRELQLVDRELTPRSQDNSGMPMVVESQARLITSNNVLLRVIDQTRLDKDPEFGGSPDDKPGLLQSLFGIGGNPAGSRNAQRTAVLDELSRHVSVRRTDKTFVVDIEAWSRDPAKAAMLANAISAAYLAESSESQASAARRATSDLSGRLKELQERLRTAETNLATYKANNNFVGTQDTLVSDQQLSEITQRLGIVRAQALDAQAKYDQIESSRKAAADGGAIPEALQSPTIANLRAQYAELRRKQAELTNELGPRHPSLRNIETQVEDLRRNINEEVNRFAQAAKNDLTRAKTYEASLTKMLDGQKRQSVDLSQASVRMRELEREVEASRAVYQSFLKRSRETEEQESLNTSNARIIGDAVEPRRRTFPPGMSLLAMIGFVLGAFAASGYVVISDLFGLLKLPAARPKAEPQAPSQPQPARSANGPVAPPPVKRTNPAPALIEKPLIARLQDMDVVRIAPPPSPGHISTLGWPALRTGVPLTPFVNTMRQLRATAVKRTKGGLTPVVAMIGPAGARDRSVATLNVALAAINDGLKVMVLDADWARHSLSDRLAQSAGSQAARRNWFARTSSSRIKTIGGIDFVPALPDSDPKANGAAMARALADARKSHDYDLVLIDGPAIPAAGADRTILDNADAVLAMLPATVDIDICMDEILDALGDAQARLIAIVLNELSAASSDNQRNRQYA